MIFYFFRADSDSIHFSVKNKIRRSSSFIIGPIKMTFLVIGHLYWIVAGNFGLRVHLNIVNVGIVQYLSGEKTQSGSQVVDITR